MNNTYDKNGTHIDAIGWAPDGTFCGECCSTTCEGCTIAEEIMKQKDEE